MFVCLHIFGHLMKLCDSNLTQKPEGNILLHLLYPWKFPRKIKTMNRCWVDLTSFLTLNDTVYDESPGLPQAA